MNIKEKIISELDELKEEQLLELENYLKYLAFRDKLIDKNSSFYDELESWQQTGINTMNDTLERIENGSW